MSVIPEEQERFASNAVQMAHLLKDIIDKLWASGYRKVNPAIVEIAAGLLGQFDKHTLIQGFITNSHAECWDYIKERNEDFFLNNAGQIFQYLPMDHVSIFKELFQAVDANGKSIIEPELREQLWDLFAAKVKICIKYIHKHRAPYSCESGAGNVGIVNAYGKSFFDEVDLAKHAATWGVQLTFPPRV